MKSDWFDWIDWVFGGVVKTPAQAAAIVNTKIPGSSATVMQIAAPGAMYPAPPTPPPTKAVAAGASSTPAPYTEEQYNAAIEAAIAQQDEAWKEQNKQFFRNSFPDDIGDDASVLRLEGIGDLLLLGSLAVIGFLVVTRK